MIGHGSPLATYFGFTGSAWHEDMLAAIVSRAIKAGFTVVLLQPDTDVRACIATDRDVKRGHYCCSPLHPLDDPSKVRPFVTAAIRRVAQRYGGTPNIAIDLAASANVLELPQATGLLVVPPSVVRGEAVTLQEHLTADGLR